MINAREVIKKIFHACLCISRDFGHSDTRFYLGSDETLFNAIGGYEYKEGALIFRFFHKLVVMIDDGTREQNFFHKSDPFSTFKVSEIDDTIIMRFIIGIFEDYTKARSENKLRLYDSVFEFRYYPPRNETFIRE